MLKSDKDARLGGASLAALCIGAVCATGAGAGSASAQPAPIEAAAAAAEPETGVQTVVVTARRRAESSQDVPLSIYAIDSDTVAERYVSDLTEVASVPNIVIDKAVGFGVPSFYIRGIGQQDSDPSLDPAVGIVVNGVFLNKPNSGNLDVFDFEQIEVLRGPQGTLFGKNTMAGLVNITTKRPGDEFAAEARVLAGNLERRDLRAAVEAPIGEKAALRVSGLWANSDGYANNRVSGERVAGDDIVSGRGTLVLRPRDNLDMTIIADATRNRSGLGGLKNVNQPTDASVFLGVLPDPDPDLNSVSLNDPSEQDFDAYGVSAEINWDIGSLVFSSITAWRAADEKQVVDSDGAPVRLAFFERDAEYNQFSEELRLTSDFTNVPIDFVAGALFLKANYQVDGVQNYDCNILTATTGAWPGCPAFFSQPVGVTSAPLVSFQEQDSTNIGVYAQGNYAITGALRLTLGARYSTEKKEFTFTQPFPPPVTREAEKRFSRFTPRIGIDYRPTQDFMLFASYATGYKSGGFNGRVNTVAEIGPYDSETVDTFEVGAKTDWFGRRLRANVTFFYNDYENLQLEVQELFAGGAPVTLVRNVASASSQGFELDVSAVPMEGLSLTASLGYLDAQYEEFFADIGDGQGARDQTYLEPRRAPEWTYNLGAVYETPVADRFLLRAAADLSYTDDYFIEVRNQPFSLHESVTLVDARLTVANSNESVALTFWGRNLTDETRVVTGSAVAGIWSIVGASAPRTWGVELALRY